MRVAAGSATRKMVAHPNSCTLLVMRVGHSNALSYNFVFALKQFRALYTGSVPPKDLP